MSTEGRSSETRRTRGGHNKAWASRDPAAVTATVPPSTRRNSQRGPGRQEFFTDSTNTSYIPSPSPAKPSGRPRQVLGSIGGGKSFKAALQAALNNNNNNNNKNGRSSSNNNRKENGPFSPFGDHEPSKSANVALAAARRSPIQVSELGSPSPITRQRSATRTPSPVRRSSDVPPLVSPASYISESSEPPRGLQDIYQQIEDEEYIAEQGDTDDDLSASVRTSPDIRRKVASVSPSRLSNNVPLFALGGPEEETEQEEEIDTTAEAATEIEAEVKAKAKAATDAGVAKEIGSAPQHEAEFETGEQAEGERSREDQLEELKVKLPSSGESSPFEEVVDDDQEMLARDELRLKKFMENDRKAFSKAGKGKLNLTLENLRKQDGMSLEAGSSSDSRSSNSGKLSEPGYNIPAGWGRKARIGPKWMDNIAKNRHAVGASISNVDAIGEELAQGADGVTTSVSSWLQNAATSPKSDAGDLPPNLSGREVAEAARTPDRQAFSKAKLWESKNRESPLSPNRQDANLAALRERSIERLEKSAVTTNRLTALGHTRSAEKLSRRSSEKSLSKITISDDTIPPVPNLPPDTIKPPIDLRPEPVTLKPFASEASVTEEQEYAQFSDRMSSRFSSVGEVRSEQFRRDREDDGSQGPKGQQEREKRTSRTIFDGARIPSGEPDLQSRNRPGSPSAASISPSRIPMPKPSAMQHQLQLLGDGRSMSRESLGTRTSNSGRTARDTDRIVTHQTLFQGGEKRSLHGSVNGQQNDSKAEGGGPKSSSTSDSGSDSHDLLLRFARASSTSPAPSRSLPGQSQILLPGIRGRDTPGSTALRGSEGECESSILPGDAIVNALPSAPVMVATLTESQEVRSESLTKGRQTTKVPMRATVATVSDTPAMKVEKAHPKTPRVVGAWIDTPVTDARTISYAKELDIIPENSFNAGKNYSGTDLAEAAKTILDVSKAAENKGRSQQELDALLKTAPKLPHSALADIVEHVRRKRRGEEGVESDDTLQIDEPTLQSLDRLVIKSEEEAQAELSRPEDVEDVDHMDSGAVLKEPADPVEIISTLAENIRVAADVNELGSGNRVNYDETETKETRQMLEELQNLPPAPSKDPSKSGRSAAVRVASQATHLHSGKKPSLTVSVEDPYKKPQKPKKSASVIAPEEECDQGGEFHDFIWPCEACRRRAKASISSEVDTIGVVQWQTVQVPRLWRWATYQEVLVQGDGNRDSKNVPSIPVLTRLQLWIPRLTTLGWFVFIVSGYGVAEHLVTSAYSPPFYAETMLAYGVDACAPRPPFVLAQLIWRSPAGALFRALWFAINLIATHVANIIGIGAGWLEHELAATGPAKRWEFKEAWEPAVGLMGDHADIVGMGEDEIWR